ncbi:hypothetical protein [Treponema berlinense]|uniref:hypothetical protein n=1 Tax=Treponema berlinense TaxID=225004 RepID=UPI003FD8990B
MKDAGIFARVPVIVISADSDAKTERECLKLGASDFIRKSFDNTIVEYRHFESGNHIKRVKGFTRILAKKISQKYPEYNLTPESIEVISDASALHDSKARVKTQVDIKSPFFVLCADV